MPKKALLTYTLSLLLYLLTSQYAFPACSEGEVEISEQCIDSNQVHYVQPGKPTLLQSVINNANKGDYIILKSGNYEIEATDNKTAILITGKKSLHLIGQKDVWIRTKQGRVTVLTIESSEDITIDNIGMIHDVKRGSCEGAVVKLLNVNHINILDATLNGSGTQAIQMENAQHVTVTGGKAISNTEGVFNIKNSVDIIIKEMVVENNDNSGGKQGILDVEGSNSVFFNYNVIKNNQNAYFKKVVDSQNVEIDGNEFITNNFANYDASNTRDATTSTGGDLLWSQTLKIHPDLPDFTFELTGVLKGKTANLKTLKVYRTKPDNSHPPQVIKETKSFQIITELDTPMKADEVDKYFKTEDVNFDGYLDLRLMETATTENSHYRFWLFNPKMAIFVENTDLKELPSLTIDADKKQIIATWKDSTTHEGTDYYQFINSKLLLIRQELKDYLEAGVYQLTIKERHNGEMKRVKQQLVREGELAVDPATLIKETWQNLEKFFANHDAPCSEEITTLPEKGLRGFYCHLQRTLNYSQLPKLAKLPIFTQGPHSDSQLNLTAKDNFGHYDKNFVLWLKDNFIPAAQDPDFRKLTQPLYEQYIKKLARTFYEVHKYLHDNPDYLEQEKQAYLALLTTRTLPDCCYETKYQLTFQYLIDQGYDAQETVVAVAFWLRRAIDGTDQAWLLGLKQLLDTYDATFIKTLEEEEKRNYKRFRDFITPIAHQYCQPNHVLLYSSSEYKVSRYSNINTAITAATRRGDVVWLCPGTYYETINLVARKHLLLYGDQAHLKTRLPKTTIITLKDSQTIEIAGLHLLHEIAAAATENGIEITRSSHIHLHDNNIEAGYHGILLTDVHDAEITGNQLHFSQKGLSARNSSNIFLRDNRFFDNSQHDISVSGKTAVDTFRNNWQTDNEFVQPPPPFPTILIDLDATVKAADQGDLVAQLNLAIYWYQEDDAKALFRFHQAAAQGHPKAQYHLGWLYYEGKGVSPDYSQAAHWFRQAAEQGYSSAQNALGGLYYEGKGVPQDFLQGAYWARKAAQQGNVKAQNNLAGLYYAGKGVPQDYGLAALWITKAAEQGYAQAQNNLGELYLQGQGVPQDIDQARQWFEKAAEQGNMKAQYNLNKFKP
jgi:hypothetical protein